MVSKTHRLTLGCSAEGCERAHFAKGLCNTHYYRIRRNGTLELKPIRRRAEKAPRAPRSEKRECAVEGCDLEEDGRAGLCKKHETRRRRHGDPLVVIEPVARALPSGVDHPRWTGNDASYGAAHQRVRRERGPARLHACVDCGGDAAHWSYARHCPNEMQSPLGPYSVDTSQYVPRCVSCHKRFDLAAIA